MTRTSLRLAAALLLAGCLGAATPALADPSGSGPSSATVSTASAGTGSRQLDLLDLAGAPLTELPLVPGVPVPFRVRITDTGVTQLTGAGAGFTVGAVLNDLYLGGDPDAAVIPSADVSVSFPGGGARNAAGSLTAAPRVVLSGSLSCASVRSALGLPLIGALTGAVLGLCSALPGTGSTAIPSLPVVSSSVASLPELVDVPFALGGQAGGAFTSADYTSGIGSADGRGAGAAGTARSLLAGVPTVSTALATQLAGVTSALAALPAVSATGAGAQTSVGAVIGKLLGTPALASIGSAMAALPPAQAAAALNTLTPTVQPLGLGDITGATGVYNAYPTLTVSPTVTPAAGSYAGTMTVTLVQP